MKLGGIDVTNGLRTRFDCLVRPFVSSYYTFLSAKGKLSRSYFASPNRTHMTFLVLWTRTGNLLQSKALSSLFKPGLKTRVWFGIAFESLSEQNQSSFPQHNIILVSVESRIQSIYVVWNKMLFFIFKFKWRF